MSILEPNQTYKELPEFLQKVIAREIEYAIDEELKEAQKRIEKRRPEIIASVILRVHKNVQYEMVGQKLIIQVEIIENK